MNLRQLLQNPRARTAFRRAFNVAGWLLVGVAGISILAAVALVSLPRVLGWQGVVVLSGSMEPALQTGDLFFVDPDVDTEALKPGDIITFRSAGGATITHRIIGFGQADGERQFVTKGDANGLPDQEFVPSERVAGKVVLRLPYVGGWSRSLQEQGNFKMLLWPLAGVIVALELWHIYGQLRRGREVNGAS